MEKDQILKLEEQINLLQSDERVIYHRQRAVRWVNQRLLENAAANAPKLASVLKEEASFEEDSCMQQLSQIGLSRRQQREYRLLCTSDPSVAKEWLKEQLLKMAQIAFRKEHGISPATWRRFLESSACPEEGTLRQIIQGLKLNRKDEEFFRAAVIREFFPVTEELNSSVRARIRQRGLSITEFLALAWISLSAWEPFQPAHSGSLTSQGTLLKLVFVFLMTPPEGWAFLGIVGSGFVTRRDLVVLACLYQGIHDPYMLYDILEYFARGSGKRRLYQNLYIGMESRADATLRKPAHQGENP